MPLDPYLIFVVVLLLAIAVAVTFAWGRGQQAFESSQRQLREKGYVVTHAYQGHRGPVTCVWGRYRAPVPFYLHFSNRDPIATAVGRLGVADMAIGRPDFDSAFYVRSNKPEWARQFLTKELCEKLVKFESLQFLTASLGTALTPDYWPEQRDRNLRDLWMLRTDGKLESPALDGYVELALGLSTTLEAFCQGRSFDSEDCATGAFEGS